MSAFGPKQTKAGFRPAVVCPLTTQRAHCHAATNTAGGLHHIIGPPYAECTPLTGIPAPSKRHIVSTSIERQTLLRAKEDNMTRFLFAIAVAALTAVAISGVSKAAPVAPVQAGVAVNTANIIPAYYYHGRYYRYRWNGGYYPYYWHGHYYHYRYYRGGRYYYR
jgi:hypothetical protein